MQDVPHPPEILEAVSAFLRASVEPQMAPHALFAARVAANALDIVRRELALGPTGDAAELARLQHLLGSEGALVELNRELARRIAVGEADVNTPGLADHLWATTLDKLAVDQPSYSGYRAALADAPPT